MTRAIAVVCEGPADLRTAHTLADRVICDSVVWVDLDRIDDHRVYRGVRGADPFLKWSHAKTIAREQKVTFVGFMRDGKPAYPDAHTAMKALLLLKRSPDPVEAVLLVRDSDGDPDRRKGLEQARQEEPWTFPIVVAVADPKRECWVLAGFDPADDERERLEEVRQKLGYYPHTCSERLTATDDQATHSAKRVHALLITSPDREDRCLTATPLDVLHQRGGRNGLADYFRELRERLIPELFDGRLPESRG